MRRAPITALSLPSKMGDDVASRLPRRLPSTPSKVPPRAPNSRALASNDDKLARKLGLASHYYDKYIEPTEDKGAFRDMSHSYKRPPSMTARLECRLHEPGVFMAAERRSTLCPGSCSVKRGVGYHAELMEDVVGIAGVSPPYTRFYIGLGCGGALTTNFCAVRSSRAMSVPQYLRRLINKKNDRKVKWRTYPALLQCCRRTPYPPPGVSLRRLGNLAAYFSVGDGRASALRKD
ncbi:hypothetical protein DFH09DRAFT_1084840 [Mycena vulgaris]|nr:hypothetical protein DFH09DRAFT_1084840 [Mycena vulgaris]